MIAIEGADAMRGLRLLETRRARELRRLSPAAERILWTRRENRGLQGAKFVRSEPIGPYFADFACRSAMLAIEIDGATHSTDEEVAHDKLRTAFLETEGYRVARFSNQRVYENVGAVVDAIARILAECAR